MTENLNRILDETGVGVCVADRDGKVIFQNEICARNCERVEDGTCPTKSVLVCRHTKALSSGTIRVPMQKVNDQFFDILGIAAKDYRTIYLVPAESSKTSRLRDLDTSALTQKEKEVIALMIADFSREKIAQVLGVSENTVKTHIKSIYAKLPEESVELIRGKTTNSPKNP